jgi:hypothetical protein
MATVSEMRQRVEALQSQILGIAGECMLEEKEQIVALVQHQQYDESVDSTGQPLRTYSPYYRLMKQRDGLYTGKTDFNLTGEMHAELNLTIDGDQYIIDSPSTTANGELKSAWLRQWQGAPIMDLTEENKKIVWEIIREPFIEKVNQVLVLD